MTNFTFKIFPTKNIHLAGHGQQPNITSPDLLTDSNCIYNCLTQNHSSSFILFSQALLLLIHLHVLPSLRAYKILQPRVVCCFFFTLCLAKCILIQLMLLVMAEKQKINSRCFICIDNYRTAKQKSSQSLNSPMSLRWMPKVSQF